MIKKFKKFDNKERFINFAKDAFADFIDEDMCEITVGETHVFIWIKLPFFYDIFLLSNMSKVINANKEQTEMIEEARVAILRIKDEFEVEPSQMFLEADRHDGEDETDLTLVINYSKKDLSIK